MSEKKCQTCQRIVPQFAPEDLCPSCLVGQFVRPQEQAPLSPALRDLPTMVDLEQRFPNYEFCECVGAGAMGVVYKAEDLVTREIVAIKIMAPQLANDPIFCARFEQEASVLQGLEHRNIVKVRTAGQHEDFAYLVMDFIAGSDLRTILRAERMDAEEIVDLIQQLCDGLKYAHEAGVIHRDIKPENVLIDESGSLQIADFGLAKVCKAKAVHATLTATGQILGTPHYMAPEQFERPDDVQYQADIYAVGVLLYEMLVGELPIGRFPLPSEKCGYSQAVDEVILRALAKAPEERYSSVVELRTAVAKVMAVGTFASWVAEGQSSRWSLHKIRASSLAVFAILYAIVAPVLMSSVFALWSRTNKFVSNPDIIDTAIVLFGIALSALIIVPVTGCLAARQIHRAKPLLWGLPLVGLSALGFPFLTLQCLGVVGGAALAGADWGGGVGVFLTLCFGLWGSSKLYRGLRRDSQHVYGLILLVNVLSILAAYQVFESVGGVRECKRVLIVKRVYKLNDSRTEANSVKSVTPVAYEILNEELPTEFYLNFLMKLAHDSEVPDKREFIKEMEYLRNIFPRLSLLQAELVKNIMSQISYDRRISPIERRKIKKIVEHIKRNNSVVVKELAAELKRQIKPEKQQRTSTKANGAVVTDSSKNAQNQQQER